MKYDVDYFIKKFTEIPADKWCKYSFQVGNKHCAMGLCGVTNSGDLTDEAFHLMNLFYDNLECPIIAINDGGTYEDFNTESLGDTPKERILVALEHIKGMNS